MTDINPNFIPADLGAPAPAPAQTPKTAINMHPKLFTGMLIGLGVAIVAGVTTTLSPDLFAALGVWQGPAFALATTALSIVGGWLKRVKAEESN